MVPIKAYTKRILFITLLGGALCGVSRAAEPEWKTFMVVFPPDPAFKDGPAIRWPEEKSTSLKWGAGTIKIPAHLKEGECIRGVMSAKNTALHDFALRNRIALYGGFVTRPYGGPHRTFLKAAAATCGHPELAHAGAILSGISNQGRFKAHFAYYWPEKVIAVILDHTWTSGRVATPHSYNRLKLPGADGVPYFFNATQKNTFQGYDRRKLHYKWCKEAFSQSQQPCTSVISYQDVNHGEVGDRSLLTLWLEDVLALRVPGHIDPDGKPYALQPVNPMKTGGHVSANIITREGRSLHTDVRVGPAGSIEDPCWWIPGPRSATEMLKWVKKNGGTVSRDHASLIGTTQGK